MKRTATYAVRRLRQTFTVFDNGPTLLKGLLDRSAETTFHTRSGLQVTVPNVPGARFPVYEIHGDDVYRLDELLPHLPADLVALDLGAHVGNFSLALAARAPGSRIHAYEASPSTARWLRRNIAANTLDDRITAHTVAMSGSVGELSFVDNAQGSAHNGMTAPTESGAVVTVPCLGFAEAVAAAGGRVDLVKMDIEGAEFDLVLGSHPGDWSTVGSVVMEYHPLPGADWSELVDFLGAAGLELVLDRPIAPGLGTAWFRRR